MTTRVAVAKARVCSSSRPWRYTKRRAMSDKEHPQKQLAADQAELGRSVEKWRSAIANAPIFIAFVDQTGTIQYLNRTQPGHSFDDAVGKQVFDYIAPQYHHAARQCLETTFRTGQCTSYEALAAGPEGVEAWYETHIGPVTQGNQLISAALFSTDITAQTGPSSSAGGPRVPGAESRAAHGRTGGGE